MKKIIVLIIVLFNILPDLHEGRVTISASNPAYAQYGCPRCVGGEGGSGNGEGGGFFGWLGNVLGDIGGFFENLGTGISEFFNNMGEVEGGEQFAEELQNDYGWTQIGGGWVPGGDPTSMGDWNDLWDNPSFTQEQQAMLQFIQQLYSDFFNNSGGAPTTPQGPKYYITVGTLPDKYYDTDSIFVMSSRDTALLVLRNENAPYVAQQTDMNWKQNNVAFAFNTIYAKPAASIGQSTIRVDSAEIKTLIQNPYEVYNRPTIIFERGIPYDGEYGFDDSSHKHASITSVAKYLPGTETTIINGSSYVVPWMSLLDGQQVTIRVTKQNLSPKAAKDPGFRVALVPSSASIKLNGQSQLILDYNALNNLNTLDVYSNQWNQSADSLKIVGTIYAVTSGRDTIGKLNISCAKPFKKKVKFIYVNTGTGFLNTGIHSRDSILNQLNLHSHNQLMRQWVLDTSFSHINLDTMDLTAEYLADTAKFHNPDVIITAVKQMFYAKKSMFISDFNQDLEGPSDPRKVHIVFVFNYPANGNTSGITDLGGVVGCFFSTSDKETFSHELGHILKLRHTFPDTSPSGAIIPNYNIPKYSTQNIMDYGLTNTSIKNMFTFFQWVDVL